VDQARSGIVRKIFVRRVRVAVDAGFIDGDPTDLGLLFFTFVEGLAAAERAAPG
jgi:hypothetical protein